MPQVKSEQLHKKSAKQSKNKVQAKRPSGQTHPTAILQRAIADPHAVSHEEMLQLQRSYGNRVMRQVLTQGSATAQKASVQKPIIQRRMGGAKAHTKALGGGVSFKGWAKGGTYNTILDDLEKYEKAEKKGTNNLSDLDGIYDKASGWLDDKTHRGQMYSENKKAVSRARAMGYVMGKIAVERGVFGFEDRQRSQRPIIHLYMGQGIVGYLGEVILQSDEFSSCSPIVFFNKFTGLGGLYHFPGGATKSMGSSRSHLPYMLAMAESIQATDIWVHSGGSSVASEHMGLWEKQGVEALVQQREDLVDEFNEHLPNTSIHEGSGRGSVNVTLGDDVGAVNITSTSTTEMKNIKQRTGSSESPHYDLALRNPPANVLRFGRGDAGSEWKKNYGEDI